MKRLIAWTLIVMISCSSLQVNASEIQQEQNVEETEVNGNENEFVELEDSQFDSEQIEEEVDLEENQKSDEEQLVEKPELENDIEQEDEFENEMRLNYLCVGEAYIESTGEQKIVISWGDGTEDITKIRLAYEKNDGTIKYMSCAEQVEELYVFTKNFGVEDKGSYQIISVEVEENEQIHSYSLLDMGIDARFGVGQVYDGYVSETSELEADISANVVQLDNNNQVEIENTVEEALSEVVEFTDGATETSVQTTGVAFNSVALSSVVDTNISTFSNASNNLVIALDPGHDATHAGAQANGLSEEVLTLKIAMYCKAALEQYSGVTVYMTRTTEACPNSGAINATADNRARIEKAVAAGADVYISFHLNSAASTSANGAEIYYPNANWKPELSTEGKGLAQDILDELVALGLGDRGIKTKSSEDNTTYEGGSLADYYTVQKLCKEKGITGLIIEHAFVSNSSDAAFLKIEANLKKLGEADAAGIAKYYGLGKGRWVQDSNGYKYLNESGNFITNAWATIDGKRYYFNNLGYRLIGWQDIDGSRYFFMPEGFMMTGWISFGSTRYYLGSDGIMKTGWQDIAGFRYFFSSEGNMKTGWQDINGSRYFFMPEGYMMTGWVSFGSTRYYLGSDGIMKTGWQDIDGFRYFFSAEGYMKTGWQDIGGSRYFFMPEGYMMTGWISFGSSARYYLDSNGVMLTGTHMISGVEYVFGSDGKLQGKSGWEIDSGKKYYYKDGVMQTGWQDIDGSRYFFMPEGYMMTGWISFGSTRYYLNSSGVMLTGTHEIAGVQYIFESDGKLRGKVGWETVSGKKYYYRDGVMQTGWQDIDGSRYFFMPEGYMMTGWISFGSTRYYLNSNGVMLTGIHEIAGVQYIFGSDGKLQGKTGWETVSGKKYYYKDGVMQTGWQEIDGSRYFFMPEGYMMTGWISFGSTRYYLDSNGVMLTGTHEIAGVQYIFGSDGKLQGKTGWETVSGKKYYYKDGVMQTGWQDIDGSRYFFMPEGYMMTGWISFGSTRYYLDQSGVMLTGTHTIEDMQYTFGNDGKLQSKTGWETVSGKKYYYKDGVMQTGWQDIEGERYFFMPEGYMMTGWISFGSASRYYLDTNGVMVTGVYSINGVLYTFGTDGKLILKNGWLTNGDKTYYYINDIMQTGWQDIEGERYFFMPEGYMMTGWISFGSKRYYMGNEGKMQTGWQDIEGERYFFMPEGYMMTGWISFGSANRYYLTSEGKMVTGWRSIDQLWYFFDEDGRLNTNPGVESPKEAIYLIEGSSSVNASKLAAYYRSKNRIYPSFYASSDAPTLETFCQIYIEECAAEGIKAEVAFTQAMKETGWLSYGGDVKIEQYNFAGIGAVGGGAGGATFSSVRIGVRAQVQHLKAYASNEDLKNELVDPRFHYVKRGSSIYVEWLGIQENPYGGGWAAAKNYGYDLVAMITDLRNL